MTLAPTPQRLSTGANRNRTFGDHQAAHVGVSIGLCLAALLPLATANAQILPGTPDGIVCSVKDPTGALPWERLVFYVSARTSDGRTLYKTLTSDPVVVFVNADGILDGPNLADCDGYAVDALLKEGRAFWLSQPN